LLPGSGALYFAAAEDRADLLSELRLLLETDERVLEALDPADPRALAAARERRSRSLESRRPPAWLDPGRLEAADSDAASVGKGERSYNQDWEGCLCMSA